MGNTDLAPRSLRQIIGIVDDIREGGLDSEIWPAVYIPYNQEPDTSFRLLVRTSQAEESLLPALGSTIREIDRGIVTLEPISMSKRIANSYSAYLHRSSAWLVGGFASLALLLSVVGLYGVIAYSVGQRTREIGVRMALGAEPRMVHRMVLKEAGRLTAVGIAAGIACALAATTLLGKMLFGVKAWDLPTLVGVIAVLAVSALVASYLPARRAAAVNPVEALRAE
jgi:ABC-type antimicrobial peptide transport system permease subunit